MFKKEKGITLVALVVTIVVLLILAGVALSLVLGNNGIIKHAQNGAQEYQAASGNEQQTLTNADKATDKLVNDALKGY